MKMLGEGEREKEEKDNNRKREGEGTTTIFATFQVNTIQLYLPMIMFWP